MSIQPMIDELFRISDDMAALMEQEAAEMTQLGTDQVARYQAEKNALGIRYQQAMSNLMARGPELQALDDDTKKALRTSQARFKCAARRNKAALKARMTVSRRLVDTVVGALKDRQQQNSGIYNRYGTIGKSPVRGYAGVTQAPRISVTLDRKL
jgi:hypothetical protein